jgi:hypothetical protein
MGSALLYSKGEIDNFAGLVKFGVHEKVGETFHRTQLDALEQLSGGIIFSIVLMEGLKRFGKIIL